MIIIKQNNWFFYQNKEFNHEGEGENSFEILDDCLWVKSKSNENIDEDMDIVFTITKEFICELKAFVMVMEATFVEEDEQ